MPPCLGTSGCETRSAFSRRTGAILALLGAISLGAGTWARADTLGDARQLSRLGEPLRLSIPVRADTGPALQERCLGIVAPEPSDGLPHILTGNVVVERQGTATVVLVSTSSAVREPVTRLVLRTGCEGSTRAYTLFLEPAGSTRQVRAVGQPGPRLAGAPGAPEPAARPFVDNTASRPTVTILPVIPANRVMAAGEPPRPGGRTAASGERTTGPSPAAAKPGADAAEAGPRNPASGSATPVLSAAAPTRTAGASEAAATPDAGPATLEAENHTLKQQLAQVSGELHRLQQAPPPARESAGVRPPAASIVPGWEVTWPIIVALAGLAAVALGGLAWRRHHTTEEWPLTGPPSHRLASRTSLAEQPVTFRQAGVRVDVGPVEPAEEPRATNRPAVALRPLTPAAIPPASLLLQPSADDLGRELEQELFIAERAHSALERAHPEIVEALVRSWGTAAARNELATLLQPGSTELARMSGEAVAELRLLLRIAQELTARTVPDGAVHAGFGPPAPAW